MALAAPARATAAPDARSFRDALARFATGVAFITATPDGEPAGLIVNSLTSVSLEPPLVSFCPSRSSLTWCRMRRAQSFGVNVLGRQHERFAERATPAGADRFAGLDWELGEDGAPLLTDALATLECEIVAEHPTGDHWIARSEDHRVAGARGGHDLATAAGREEDPERRARAGRSSCARRRACARTTLE